jgi:FMN phosphatase YigB (HAD superfamily)
MRYEKIYIIYCPDTKVPVYVGVTSQSFVERMKQHYLYPINPGMKQFMDRLKSEGRYPICRIIKQIRTSDFSRDAYKEEKWYIRHLQKKGFKLYNMPNGVPPKIKFELITK